MDVIVDFISLVHSSFSLLLFSYIYLIQSSEQDFVSFCCPQASESSAPSEYLLNFIALRYRFFTIILEAG
jgi:hypothetical protein